MDELKQGQERRGPSWITSSLWQLSVSGVVDSCRSVIQCHVLYTFLQYFPHAVINWIQILRNWRPQLRWNKFWSSLSNNAIIERAQWWFQVSHGSVETLFRWGGKHLHHVTAYLFRKLCAKFHQNCPSFIADITENILVSFFPDTVYKLFIAVSTGTKSVTIARDTSE